MMFSQVLVLCALLCGVGEAFQTPVPAFVLSSPKRRPPSSASRNRPQRQQQLATTSKASQLFASTEEDTAEKAAPMITGEELELMMQDWDTPLVIDAYATW